MKRRWLAGVRRFNDIARSCLRRADRRYRLRCPAHRLHAGPRGGYVQGLRRQIFVIKAAAAGTQAVISPRSNRLTPRSFDRHFYRDYNLIERFLACLKHFRRVAARYDRLVKLFLFFGHLACAFVWLA